jgi:hypothetical protein
VLKNAGFRLFEFSLWYGFETVAGLNGEIGLSTKKSRGLFGAGAIKWV